MIGRRKPQPAAQVLPPPEPERERIAGQVTGAARGRACATCAVTWRSADPACWMCGRPGRDSAASNLLWPGSFRSHAND